MSSQPEAKLSSKIMHSWRKRGAVAWKVHGGPHQMAGVPDICGIYKGLSIWCETKMPGGQLSALQVHRIAEFRAAGALIVVAHSVEEADALLEHIDREHQIPEDRCYDLECPYEGEQL